MVSIREVVKMKTYRVTVSGTAIINVEANNEDEAWDKVYSICSGEMDKAELGLLNQQEVKEVQSLPNFEIEYARPLD
jgi:hypothetical protein